MPRKNYSTEQIVTKLRQAEIALGRGLRTPQVCKKLGVSEQTYYRWRREYGGLRLNQCRRACPTDLFGPLPLSCGDGSSDRGSAPCCRR